MISNKIPKEIILNSLGLIYFHFFQFDIYIYFLFPPPSKFKLYSRQYRCFFVLTLLFFIMSIDQAWKNYIFHYHLQINKRKSFIINFFMSSKKRRQDDQSFEVQSYSSESIVGNYNVITYRDRIRLIEMVCLEKRQIIEAASELKIKISTAKYILRCFRKNNKVLLKNQGLDGEKRKFEQQIMSLKQKIEAANKERLKKKVKQAKKNKKIADQEKITETVGVVKQQAEIHDEDKNKEISQCLLDFPQFPPNMAPNQSLIYYFAYNPFWPNFQLE